MDKYEGDMWSSQWISNLSNWNKEAWKKKKIRGFNRIDLAPNVWLHITVQLGCVEISK